MKVTVRSIGPVWKVGVLVALLSPTTFAIPAHADNNRLNVSVAKMVYIVQHQAGCTNNVQTNPQLQLAAQWHALDVRNNRALNGDTGSDGSSPQVRANAAGYRGQVQETVAINPALSVTSFEVINMWYHRPEILAIMQNCANTEIGVWSENSLDRTVLVAVYGQPAA
jgi:uncharacterized protein YkwD